VQATPSRGRLPAVHAHRGASAGYPENTMAAFRAAAELGADAIEFDVHATADGQLVVVHDYDLARTTSGSGLVHDRELAYVRTLSAGAWFAERFAAERVPLLAEVLELQGVDFELEVKGLPSAGLVSGVADAVANARVAARVELTGHHQVALVALRRRLPECRFGLLAPACAPWMTDRLYQEIVTHTALCAGFDTVHVPAADLARIEVGPLHASGLLLHAADPATGDELSQAIAWSDQLTTDDPQEALRLRSAIDRREGAAGAGC
jgi:glycerophosphoryl diester phosphodiesterase